MCVQHQFEIFIWTEVNTSFRFKFNCGENMTKLDRTNEENKLTTSTARSCRLLNARHYIFATRLVSSLLEGKGGRNQNRFFNTKATERCLLVRINLLCLEALSGPVYFHPCPPPAPSFPPQSGTAIFCCRPLSPGGYLRPINRVGRFPSLVTKCKTNQNQKDTVEKLG